MTDRYANIRKALADMDAAAEARNGIAWRDAHARYVVHTPPDIIRELLDERDRLAITLRAEIAALRKKVESTLRELQRSWK